MQLAEAIPASDERQVLLERCSLLAALPPGQRHDLTRGATVVRHPRRTEVVLEDRMMVVSSGRVRLFRGDRDRGLTIGYRGAGELAGERCWIGPTRLSLVTMEPTEGLVIPSTALRRLVSESCSVAAGLAAILAHRERELEERIHEMLTRSVDWRVVRFVLHAAESGGLPDPLGVRLDAKYTHVEIASYIGSTRETVTLVLGDLKRTGLIDVEKRRIIVRDIAALRARLG